MKISKDALWPKKSEGVAQVPFVYPEEHSFLLNYISICQIQAIDGFYEISDVGFNMFKNAISIGREFANNASEGP